MTPETYKVITDRIRSAHSVYGWSLGGMLVARAIADAFAEIDSSFDRDQFLAECGLEPPPDRTNPRLSELPKNME